MTKSMFRLILPLLLSLVTLSVQVKAQTGDGGAADGASNSDIGGATNQGNQGPSSSTANLSTGAIVAISVVVVVVIVGIITLATLFYLAKKRQWEVREKIRRTATRVAAAMTPRTPKIMSFSPNATRKTPKTMRFQDDAVRGKKGRAVDDRDLEKGSKGLAISIKDSSDSRSSEESKSPNYNGTGEKRQRSKPANITVPSSQFDMDSPKTPMWQKMFGRR